MRIYLDSNVFRDLKKPENRTLYERILKDKDSNYYSFSEAHIQDLVRDNSDKKLQDMDFMKTIVTDNCWYYDKRLQVKFMTPHDYYSDSEWEVGTDIMTSDDQTSCLIRETFRAIPLNWKQFIDTDQLPADFPEDLKPMFLNSVTMLDFMEAMLDLTDDLSDEQSKFKSLLQYLHRSAGLQGFYESAGIKGFDGNQFNDWDAFVETFKKMVYDRSTAKDSYNLIIEMLFSLDIYGIVKGKPRKQKFMSLLNDGKHVYYAAHAHILVTSDADMIAKAKMMYRIWNLATNVMTPEEFTQYLMDKSSGDASVSAMFSQFDRVSELPTILEEFTLDQTFVQKKLPTWYLGEFNTLNCATARGNTYYYFSQYFPKISSDALIVELERVVNILTHHFGNDELGRGKFESTELENNEWKGREWRNGEMGILLHLNNGLMLSFFRAAPPQEEVTKESQ